MIEFPDFSIIFKNNVFCIFFVFSYPNIVVVPGNTPDDNFAKIGKGFRHCRFPVITWKSDNGALLVRGAGFTAQTVVSRLRKQANFLGNNDNQNMGNSGSYSSLNSRDMAAPNSVELQVHLWIAFVLTKF